MAILMDFLAFEYWSSYFYKGNVLDGKHGITFIGEAAFGHLAFATIGALVFTFFAVKSILEFYGGVELK